MIKNPRRRVVRFGERPNDSPDENSRRLADVHVRRIGVRSRPQSRRRDGLSSKAHRVPGMYANIIPRSSIPPVPLVRISDRAPRA
jgi:hypothetical protein